MTSDALENIPKNPPQAPPSLFRVTRSLKVRGDAIYIIFGGIVASVFVFSVVMDCSAILAVSLAWMPLAGALRFYFKFVREKPEHYFDYCLNSIFGHGLVSPKKKSVRLERKKSC